jgi:histidinol-phosphate/aromatic aminotransferase/cobyric acid decarboxylase-like protein
LLCDFEKNGIKVLNTSGAPLLKNTFRVSVGTPDENEYFIACLRESLIGL